MSIQQEPESIVNMLRLSGLKNLSGKKRVLPGAEFLNELDIPNADFAGIPPSNPAPMPPMGDIHSQNDVRANEVIDPMTKLAQSLNPVQNVSPSPDSPPPIETQQVEESEGLPPVNPEEQSGFWNKIGNALGGFVRSGRNVARQDPIGRAVKESVAHLGSSQLREENKEKYLNPHGGEPDTWELLKAKLGGANLGEEREARAQQRAQTKQIDQEQLDAAQRTPLEVAVYGATDEFSKHPELQKDFKEITGIDFTPDIQQLTDKYEAVITGMDKELAGIQGEYDDQMKRIKKRIDSGNTTEMDKWFVGLALVMPLLIGGIFGKEAGLGALGGAAKGVGDIYARRAKETAEGEEMLAGLNKERGNLSLRRGELDVKRVGIGQEIRKNLPKDEKEFLKGKREVIWTDPKSGEEKVGVEVKPGLVALPQYITSPNDLKEMQKEANDINEAKTATQLIDELTSDIIDISSKLKDKNVLSKGINAYLTNKRPDLASKLNEQVEFEGRKVNAGIVLEHKLKLLTDAYRQAKGMRALTNTVQEHIEGLFRNPTQSFQSYQDTIDQMLYTRDLAHKNLINNATNHGFAPEFLQEEFGSKNKKIYNRLNQKEGEKESSALLREA